MIMQFNNILSILTTLKQVEPIINLTALILLAIYVIATWSIKRSSVTQSEAVLRPCLVLEQRNRDQFDQIMDHLASTELAEKIIIHNIGTGPALEINYSFRQVGPAKQWSFLSKVPYLLSGEQMVLPVSRSMLTAGEFAFEATYKSLSETVYSSTLKISDAALTEIHINKVPRRWRH
jgi:hypothetical protein